MDSEPRGRSATCAPKRPNPIGLSVVQLDKLEDDVLHIQAVDILDGTPLLDIEPYVPEFEAQVEVRNGLLKKVRKNLINGQEVKSLLFGRKITGTSFVTGKQLWWEWAKSGEFKYITGPYQAMGKSWVEGDVLFLQFEKVLGGLPDGTTIFRNPDGSRESKNQYFMVSDIGSITAFAPTE